jgi:putative membrane-bound dehydrogenase-like protein
MFGKGLARGCLGIAVVAGICFSCLTTPTPAQSKPDKPGPLSPQEELATLRVSKGFRIELVACEPQIIDPVAMAFDEEGRLFVVEMPGYPSKDGAATAPITSGRVKMLEDRDGDGFFEHSTVYVDRLRFPTSALPWRGGVLVANAPEILFCKDTDGDGRADQQRTLYTGFGQANSEGLFNALQWGLDNWVYGCGGTNGGTIRSTEKPDRPALTLGHRGFRFHPGQPGSLETTSTSGQYGLASDDWQQWFTNYNNRHLVHCVLPEQYLRRNPSLAVSAVAHDIPDHDPACKLYRLSPYEAWRVERTRRRRKGIIDAGHQFPASELVPGGYVTSGCSPVVYTADLFPPAYRGNTFMCDPANNLIHRDVLEPHGATFVAKRADVESEFLASTHIWFRPVFLTVGPDGALYVADFYREVIETPDPRSMPPDILKTLHIESQGHGRIWRVIPEDARPMKKPALGKASVEELVQHLDNPNRWWRQTAQRLVVERQDRNAVKLLEKLAREAHLPQGRAHALWTLRGLQALGDDLIEAALKDRVAEVREQALRLAEDRLSASAGLRTAVIGLADDPSPRVRFQLAFTLGEADTPETRAALAKIIQRDLGDSWIQTAALSSAARSAPGLLEMLVRDQAFTVRATAAHLQLLTQLATQIGARPGDSDLASTLDLLAKGNAAQGAWQEAILKGLGQGLQNRDRPFSQLWKQPPPALKASLEQCRRVFAHAAATARDEKADLAARLPAVRLLAYGPFEVAAEALRELLQPQNPDALQLAAVRALSLQDSRQVPEMLLALWDGYSPAVRREVLEALFGRPERLLLLLKAMEQKKVLAGQIEPFYLDQLRKHPDGMIRGRAQSLLANQATPDREKIVAAYQSALDLKADVARGKQVFKKTCATCHRLENEGIEVGPDLRSALRNKTRPGLLADILDPSREVDPRFINYVIVTKGGRVLTGMIAAETASSITLRRAEKAEDTVLRSQIDEIKATAKSLMPDGLEMQLTKQDVADVIAYLQSVVSH